tara:strand:- start:8100 stop:8747 length:648 start_codon:yes stop_codon:yes gene_type:complete
LIAYAIGILVVGFITFSFFSKSSQNVKIFVFLVFILFVGLILFIPPSESDESDTGGSGNFNDMDSPKTDTQVDQPPVPKQYLVTVEVSSIHVINDSEYKAPGQVYFVLEFDDNVFRIPETGEITVKSGTTIDVALKKTFKILEDTEVSLKFNGTEVDPNHSDTPEDDLGHITPRTFTINDGFSKQIHEGSSTGHYNVKISIDSEVISEEDKSDSQ